MRTVHVSAGAPYDVLIGRGLLEDCGIILQDRLGRTCKAAILTDDVVDGLYGAEAEGAMKRAGFEVCRYSVPHGEENKNISTWSSMLDFLSEQRLTRSDVVVALGGGVVGDLAGFAASSYLRGIPFMQIPTTLLAMVDSSVGGKTGLNLPAGKNLAGAFYQPCVVLCDPDLLWTLTPHQLADGVAEVIKYGVLGDESLFELLKDGHWHDRMLDVIETCVSAKARLVEADEHDKGSRQLLNYGHTLGHAIEKCSAYSISHGHAVAVGMVYAARIAEKLGLCNSGVRERLVEALLANHLPAETCFSADDLLNVVLSDKKRNGDSLTWVLPRAIGDCTLQHVPVSELSGLIRYAVEEE